MDYMFTANRSFDLPSESVNPKLVLIIEYPTVQTSFISNTSSKQYVSNVSIYTVHIVILLANYQFLKSIHTASSSKQH